jgi:hypothetical protein
VNDAAFCRPGSSCILEDPETHSFDLGRALPGRVPGAIRTTALGAIDKASRLTIVIGT